MVNNLFRFVVVRPPQRVAHEELVIRNIQTHPSDMEPSTLLQDLLRLRKVDDRIGMKNRSTVFLDHSTEQNGFVVDLNSLTTPINTIDNWLLRHRESLHFSDFRAFIVDEINQPLTDVVLSDEYKSDRTRVADSLLALYISGDSNRAALVYLTRAIRIFGLLEHIAKNVKVVVPPFAIASSLQANVMLPGKLYPLPKIKSKLGQLKLEEHQKRLKVREQQKVEVEKQIKFHKKLTTVVDQLVTAYDQDWRTLATQQPTNISSPGRVEVPRSGLIATFFGNLFGTSNSFPAPIMATENVIPSPSSFLSDPALNMLTEETLSVLSLRGIKLETTRVPDAIATIEAEIFESTRKIYNLEKKLFESSGEVGTPESQFNSPQSSLEPLHPGPGSVHPPSLGELMIVEQDLQRYELGEIAHIENVLKGEFRERTHRRSETVEDTLFSESESTEEAEREFESNERFELQSESQKVIKEQTSLEAGLTVSGNYGWVSMTADARYAKDTAKEESNKTSSKYSRDVTERAVSRIKERTLTSKSRRLVRISEETNLHRIDNVATPSEHMSGIYRWVDKVYKCQLVNYGQRAMYEFVIPQPAAFLKQTMSSQPLGGVTLEKPKVPGRYTLGGHFIPLRPTDISPDDSTYLNWAAEYKVSDIQPPPPRVKIVGKAFHKVIEQKPNTAHVYAHSDSTMSSPPGYVAKRAWYTGGAFTRPPFLFKVVLGNKTLAYQNQDANLIALDNKEDDIVPISIQTDRALTYAFTVEIECERTAAEVEKWQLATYDAIMIAYRELQAQYDDQVSALQVQQGIDIEGRNPIANRKLEQIELKRSALSVLTDQHFDHFDAMRSNVPTHGFPELDLEETALEGPYIKFFEQAFEWENMTYLFYPYFWGNKEDWTTNALLDDNDPLFAQFLRAGAARVIVPARPGFEASVCSYLNNGWPIPDDADAACPGGEGGDGMPEFSIADEIKAQQGYDATPGEGSLTVRQDDSTVTGVDTVFDEGNDIDREIHIKGAKYRINTVVSPTEISLKTAYSGSDEVGVSYSLGVRYVYEPWEVRVPTSLVSLGKNSDLPELEE